jgi:hypothetical protein
MARGAAAVQVDRDIGLIALWWQWLQGSYVDDPVDRSRQCCERCKDRRRSQQAVVIGKGTGHAAHRGHRGQQIAEPKGPKHQYARPAHRAKRLATS